MNARIAATLEARALAPDGILSGYASIFGLVDGQGDVVAPGAFRASLAAWRARRLSPPMLWQHEAAEPIGIWTALAEDGRGLAVTGRLALGTRRGREAFELLRLGAVTGLSIGYAAVEATRDPRTGTRTLRRVTLREISLVTFPANDGARVADVKAEARLLASLRRATAALR
ncbi:HK97 family phage prohead protease [Zavarzinia sp. CC-PAN008]|uniref:HK97 family phage prohead protease n=1 Tax=Zavarzinia sp. CC-PAN008 TaxID=3243332 RepID=UPI003F74A4AF